MLTHCAKNNLNLRLKIEPAMAGADAKAFCLFSYSYVRIGIRPRNQINNVAICSKFFAEIQIICEDILVKIKEKVLLILI